LSLVKPRSDHLCFAVVNVVSNIEFNEKPILALTLRLPWSQFPVDCSNYLKEMVEREGIEPSTPAL
jgi:hypothetical protein